MSSKNYGPAVSGYLDPTGRNWENPVFQAGKPLLDKEVNLASEVAGKMGQDALRRIMPSGWIADDFLDVSDPTAGIFTPSPTTANLLAMPGNLVAHVNGWVLPVTHTGAAGINQIELPAPPTNDLRTDIIILEVWRRLIHPASSPSAADGKSGSGNIWLNGNVKISPADDSTLNLADDLLDTNVGAETTKRVQIQYRLRTIPNIDLSQYPTGIDDPTVVANTVPPTAAEPDGVATAYTYAGGNQSAAGDSGLWVAGTGDLASQTALGTVDGFMYAIPLMAVVRRNTLSFARLDNHNGGVVYPGPSDRPDGLLSDIVAAQDIVDLRFGVSPTGWNYQEVLDRNLRLLLDNNLRTEWVTTNTGGGYFGHTTLCADEVGVQPGLPPLTGYTTAGTFIGQFDSVRRHFSDRSTIEFVTLQYAPSGANWTSGEVVTITPSALPIYLNGTVTLTDWTAANPLGGRPTIRDIQDVRWVGTDTQQSRAASASQVGTIENVGKFPIGAPHPTFKIVSVPSGITSEYLYVTMVVEYPAGLGLTRTPVDTHGIEVTNQSVLPTATLQSSFDKPHREVGLLATFPTVTLTMRAIGGTASQYLPEVPASLVSVKVNTVPVLATWDAQAYRLVLPSAAAATDVIEVEYVPLCPVPYQTLQTTIFYTARAPQTVEGNFLPSPLRLIPRYKDKSLHALTVGSGSLSAAYPYDQAYVQVGGIYPDTLFSGDHQLRSNATVTVSEFSGGTGLMRLPIYVEYAADPDAYTLTRTPSDIDAEQRTFYSDISNNPNAYATPLTDAKRHRNFLAVLTELPETTVLGYRGQLVLVLMVREALFDKDNSVYFTSTSSHTTAASVFRVKGNLLNKRA